MLREPFAQFTGLTGVEASTFEFQNIDEELISNDRGAIPSRKMLLFVPLVGRIYTHARLLLLHGRSVTAIKTQFVLNAFQFVAVRAFINGVLLEGFEMRAA